MTGTRLITLVLVLVAALGAWRVAMLGLGFNGELQLTDPALARSRPAIVDPKTPRLSQRVILVMVDGLRLDESRGPGFDAVRAAGIDGAAGSHYPTVSRPNYITLLTGVPPLASGIRANRVRRPIRLDSMMARAKAVGLRVVNAGDIGNIAPLFVSPEVETSVPDHPQTGDLVTPAAGYTWPFDEVRKVDTLAALDAPLAAALAKPSDLVIVMTGDVDRAGHAYGVGAEYRDAAARTGAMIGRLLAQLDLTRDTLIITADHGHVDRGGHGGPEEEAMAVPLLIAGAGVVPGAHAPAARLVDVAPTITALLGIPAPGHSYGRALVELLDPRAAAYVDADVARLAAVRAFPEDVQGIDVGVLALTGVALLAAFALAIKLRIPFRRGSWVGVLAFVCILAALAAATRGRLSPSEVPALYRLQRMLAVCAAAAIAIQLVSSWHVARAFANRLSISNGISLIALSISLGTVFIVRGCLPVPHVDVPEPAWLVAIPAVEIAAAVSCVAVTLHLIFELVVSVRGTDDHGR